MSTLTFQAYGIAVELPTGFEAHIFRRVPGLGERSFSVSHFSTFPLPADVGDFGGGAVTLMGPSDVFAVLFEFGPESVGKKLFDRIGIPRGLTEAAFHPHMLRRGVVGQAGTQWFFTEAGRPFTFYAVLGSYVRRDLLVPKINDLLSGLRIAPLPSSGAEPTHPLPQWN